MSTIGAPQAVRATLDVDQYSETIRPLPFVRRALTLISAGGVAGRLAIEPDRLRWTPRPLGRIAGIEPLSLGPNDFREVGVSRARGTAGLALVRVRLNSGKELCLTAAHFERTREALHTYLPAVHDEPDF